MALWVSRDTAEETWWPKHAPAANWPYHHISDFFVIVLYEKLQERNTPQPRFFAGFILCTYEITGRESCGNQELYSCIRRNRKICRLDFQLLSHGPPRIRPGRAETLPQERRFMSSLWHGWKSSYLRGRKFNSSSSRAVLQECLSLNVAPVSLNEIFARGHNDQIHCGTPSILHLTLLLTLMACFYSYCFYVVWRKVMTCNLMSLW